MGVHINSISQLDMLFKNNFIIGTALGAKLFERPIKENIESCICTKEFKPVVCFDKSKQLFEFDNQCMAACEGHSEKNCKPAKPCNCTKEKKPVTCKGDGEYFTFPNQCMAECEGFDERNCKPDNFVKPCICYYLWEPVVCGKERKMYSNLCKAECDQQ